MILMIGQAYNRMTLQDNRIVTSIAFLTMIFLPAAFISVSH